MRAVEADGIEAVPDDDVLDQIPGARARVSRGNSLNLRNADGGLRFALVGSNYESIAQTSEAFVVSLEKHVPEVENLRVEFRATQPQLSVSIDRRRAIDLGVPIDNLAATIQVLVDNREVVEMTVDDQRIPVILQKLFGDAAVQVSIG